MASAFLCADKPKKTTGADIRDGTTIDQIIAQHVGQGSLLPSCNWLWRIPARTPATVAKAIAAHNRIHFLVDANLAVADGTGPPGGL